MFRLRYATAEDFEQFVETPLMCRVRAFAAVVDDDRVIGVGGLAFLPDGTTAAFVHATDEARNHRFAAHKAGLRAMEEAKRLGIRRIVATASPEVEAAERWLLRLGFREAEVDGAKVFIWH